MKLKTIDLYQREPKSYVPSVEIRTIFAQAASICFHFNKFENSTILEIEGYKNTKIRLTWQPVDQQMIDNWKDLQEATEYGATHIAILMIEELTHLKVIQRSPKMTGFDYWLGKEKSGSLFQKLARLEVSGILKGTESQVNRRLKEKIKQTEKSDHIKLPAFISIVEFSMPVCKIRKNEKQ